MSEDGHGYSESLGERLRNVRQQQGLSLHDVGRASGGSLKASVVGAYERGERAVSVTRLRSLADFYRVPISQLLPEPGIAPERSFRQGRLRLDLTQVPEASDEEFEVVARYLSSIQARRGDYNGRTLTIRGSDLTTLAAVLDTQPEILRERLVDVGMAVPTA